MRGLFIATGITLIEKFHWTIYVFGAFLSITTDPFIVYSSNVFAILGLRALYFAVAGLMPLFHYLNVGLSAVLVFIGAKMLLTEVYKMPVGPALGVVAGILVASMLASMVRARRTPALEAAGTPQEDEPRHAPPTQETAR